MNGFVRAGHLLAVNGPEWGLVQNTAPPFVSTSLRLTPNVLAEMGETKSGPRPAKSVQLVRVLAHLEIWRTYLKIAREERLYW